MTALVLSFPSDRVIRTPAQVEKRREDWINANVARLVELLEHDPRFASIRAKLDSRPVLGQGAAELPS